MPPRPPRAWLRRPRLDQLLARAIEYPVTVMNASAGYGKSSALASFAARGGWPTIWYSLGDGSADPLVFLLHLAHACHDTMPRVGERVIGLLKRGVSGAPAWRLALDALINDLVLALDDETILVLDDEHAIDNLPDIRALIERLIAQRPPRLHILLATRQWPQLTSLPILRARGELLILGEADLAFTGEEIEELFESAYQHRLSAEEVQTINEQTGGWAIALKLIGQSAGAEDEGPRTTDEGGDDDHPSLVLGLSSMSREALFVYLAQEVLARQPEAIQAFLLRSSILDELDPLACDSILGRNESAVLLQQIERRGLFLTLRSADRYRYHPLFHAFLQERARAALPEWADLHRQAVAYFRSIGASEHVVDHLLAIGDLDGAAVELEGCAQSWYAMGRCVTLLGWLSQLPAVTLNAHPQLLIWYGDAARFLARFEPALQAYAEAERVYAAHSDTAGQARALRGQALVFLDTVQPTLASDPLRRAFRLLPRDRQEERAELLDLIAENRLNGGRADQAARLYRLAGRMTEGTKPRATNQHPRLLLHLGRLDEARALLEAELRRDRALPAMGWPAEADREPTVLLALICALHGQGEAALRYAQQATEVARQRGSALLEAVAHIRAGHALQLLATPDEPGATTEYLQAIALMDSLGVERTKAEAYLGLALLHGFGGNLAAGQASARAGLAIVERSGDAWTAALLWTALGAISITNGAADGDTWLYKGLSHYRRCRDTYGEAVSRLWLSIWHQRAGRDDQAAQGAIAVLALARRHNYSGLLTVPTLFGPRDRMMLVPLLLTGRGNVHWSTAADQLLAQGFPAVAADSITQTYHPGATLRVQAFGQLRVWRGGEAITASAWQRKKAIQLFGLLLTNRHRWLLREQISHWLWPEEGQAAAQNQFKVTLNALNTALEPARPPRTSPFYIRRQGSAYRFCPPDGVWLDVAEFEMRVDRGMARLAADRDDSGRPALDREPARAHDDLAAAVALYRDDYLSEYLYEDWAREERERLLGRYLEAATSLAAHLAGQKQLPQAIQFCELILARDPCWEQAYSILMRAYAWQGNRRQALATYERCVRNLRTHLDMAPLPETTQIYEQIRS
jgi:ATP/maltotriose-dependent transcriptional regulator MalT/DNA-binding SARP family transcriptional activator